MQNGGHGREVFVVCVVFNDVHQRRHDRDDDQHGGEEDGDLVP